MRIAASRAFWTAGSSRPIRTAMIAITTSNSMREKADGYRRADRGEHMGPLLSARPGKRVRASACQRRVRGGKEGHPARRSLEAEAPEHNSTGRSSGLRLVAVLELPSRAGTFPVLAQWLGYSRA